MSATEITTERGLVGAIMALSAFDAERVTEVAPPADYADPIAADIARWCAELAAEGIAPEPALVHARAQRQGCSGARLVERGIAIAEAYGLAPAGPMAFGLAADVRGAACRRRAQQAAARLGQAADSGDLSVLAGVIETEIEALRTVTNRLLASPVGAR